MMSSAVTLTVRTGCLLAAGVGIAGMAVGRGPGLGLFVALVGLLWGMGWLAVAWTLVRDTAVRTVTWLALLAGGLLIASSLVWAGWLPEPVALRCGVLALLTVLPLLWICYPSRPAFLVLVTCVPVLVALGVAAVLLPRLDLIANFASLVVSLLVIAALWWRLERGQAGERDSVLWLVAALGTSVLVVLPLMFVGVGPATTVVVSLMLLLINAATVLGLRPPRQINVRLLILRLSVYAVTALAAVGLFSGSAAALEWGTGEPPSIGVLALLAVGVGAVFYPIRRVLDGVLGRLLFGDRVDALTAASRFGDELTTADDPLVALRALRQVLWLPYVALVDTPTADTSSGTVPIEGTYRLPLRVGESSVGALVIGLRPGERGPHVQDRDMLRIVVPALAQAVNARALAAELTRSHGRVVSAIEDERRRLRHDLHDGLGPTLTGVAYAADAALNHVRNDPHRAEDLLARLAGDTRDAVAEVRRLVDGLRPSTLDELGLVAAVRQHSTHLHTAHGRRLEVWLDVAEPLPNLSAATEVAAYRIVTEALTNVARHAEADHAAVQIMTDEHVLKIQINDHGPGAATWLPGVGLTSMRERAEQLGGTFSAGATPEGGRVTAMLPLG